MFYKTFYHLVGENYRDWVFKYFGLGEIIMPQRQRVKNDTKWVGIWKKIRRTIKINAYWNSAGSQWIVDYIFSNNLETENIWNKSFTHKICKLCTISGRESYLILVDERSMKTVAHSMECIVTYCVHPPSKLRKDGTEEWLSVAKVNNNDGILAICSVDRWDIYKRLSRLSPFSPPIIDGGDANGEAAANAAAVWGLVNDTCDRPPGNTENDDLAIDLLIYASL